MNAPIFERLNRRFRIAVAEPKMPTRTVLVGAWSAWCVVCEGEDFTHEHPDDMRAPRFGEPVERPTDEEWAYIRNQRALPIGEQHYYQRLKSEVGASA